MMKAFARWLFMRYFYDELLAIARYVRDPPTGEGESRSFVLGKATGTLDTLKTLDLLVRP